jgi:cytochrome c556
MRAAACLPSLLPLLLAAVLVLPAPAVHAQDIVPGPWGDLVEAVKPLSLRSDVERVTHYRRLQMNAMSSHFRSLEAVFTYGAPFAGRTLADAEAMVGLAEGWSGLFVEGSAMVPGTWGARPAIWSERERFAQHVAGLQSAVRDLRDTLRASDRSRDAAAMTAVRHQCLACHQRFREFRPGTR